MKHHFASRLFKYDLLDSEIMRYLIFFILDVGNFIEQTEFLLTLGQGFFRFLTRQISMLQIVDF